MPPHLEHTPQIRRCVIEGHVTHLSSPPSVRSVAGNNICYRGNMEGLNALIAAIKELPNLCSLKCASSLVLAHMAQACWGV